MVPLAPLATVRSHNTGGGKGGADGALSMDLLSSKSCDFCCGDEIKERGSSAMWNTLGGMSSGVCHFKFANYVFSRWQNGVRADAKA